MIIGVIGKKYHGKDTCADYIVNNYDFIKKAYADPIKRICKNELKFTDEQLYGNKKEDIDPRWGFSPREAMQKIGTQGFRELREDIWVKIMEMNFELNKNIVISDVRFKNEADLVKKYNGILIKIKRLNMNDIDNHESEKYINDIIYDYEIINDADLNSIYNKLDDIMKNIGCVKK
jgi:hypothetical protein